MGGDGGETPNQLELWKGCGGEAALRSYAILDGAGSLADVPDEHWEFLDRFCRDYYETSTHIFVHAGAYADLPMEEQSSLILRWETFNDPPAHESGKIVVCGHTPQREGRPRESRHAICMDTKAHERGGWLAC